jgi:hypothetical protein
MLLGGNCPIALGNLFGRQTRWCVLHRIVPSWL